MERASRSYNVRYNLCFTDSRSRHLLRLREDLAIAFWDERLSTMAVNRMLIETLDMTRARRAEVVDRAAAADILQGALDQLQQAAS